jgi:hypothetical protein
MKNVPAALGPLGVVIPALIGAAWLCVSFGRLFFRGEPAHVRYTGGITFALALFSAGVDVVSRLGLLSPALLLSGLGVTCALTWYAQRRRLGAAGPPISGPLMEGSAIFALAAGAATLALATLAAYWLPIWHWDSLGYHLPFVNFLLQGGGASELPPDVPYLSTYPHRVELLFVALRATLPDDRLLDLGQIPLGIVGGAATAAVARELGARPVDAVLAGVSWLSIPAVFLQLPTNYVDVGGAAFFLLAAALLLPAPTPPTLITAGLAIGLFLGTKPSAPPAAALLAGILLVRGARRGLLRPALLGLLGTALLGLDAYLVNLVRHGNPVWPAVVSLGPLTLPGTVSVEELLSSGAATEKVTGPLLWRVIRSWTSFTSSPVFDMRVGGLGLLFWVALPAAVVFTIREKKWLFALLSLAALTVPDPAVARYILPFPALLLAAALALAATCNRRVQKLAHGVLAAAGVYNLWYSTPGLTGEGPPLFAYAALSWEEREAAVGANGSPRAFIQARNELEPGEIAVYDSSVWLPYLLWRSDLQNRVLRVPDGADVEPARGLLSSDSVRLLAIDPGQSAAAVIREHPERYRHLFTCRESCDVYRLR